MNKSWRLTPAFPITDLSGVDDGRDPEVAEDTDTHRGTPGRVKVKLAYFLFDLQIRTITFNGKSNKNSFFNHLQKVFVRRTFSCTLSIKRYGSDKETTRSEKPIFLVVASKGGRYRVKIKIQEAFFYKKE